MDIFSEYTEIINLANNYFEEEKLFNPVSYPSEICGNIEKNLSSCEDCESYKGINPHVRGVGASSPDLLILGDVPGSQKESISRCFNIDAGTLFTKMLAAMKLKPSQIYISTIYKCYGDDFQDFKCQKWLDAQIEELQPKVILALGEVTIKKITGSDGSIKDLRGEWFNYNGIPVMGTYHPEDLNKDTSLKREAWDDLQKVMRVL